MASFNRQLSSGQGRKNILINGNFDIWQRAASQTVAGYGSADRWLFQQAGSTFSTSRQTFATGQTAVPNNPKYYYSTAVTSVAGAGNFAVLVQRIENVRTLAGKTCTLSFYASASASLNIAVEFAQYFGLSGSSTVTAIGSQKVALTTSWTKYDITVNIPSISGKTIDDATNDHFISINFWLDAGSNFNSRTASLGQQSGTFYFSQIQIEQGSIATDFEQRSFGEELILCQRYYEKSYPQGTNPGAVNFLTGSYYIVGHHTTSGRRAGTVSYKVTKRASPAVTTYDYAGTTSRVTTLDTVGNIISSGITPTLIISDGAFIVYVDSTTASGLIANWAADAEL